MMWTSHQQGNRYFEESESSQESEQSSQSSEEMESSQEEKKQLDPWSRIRSRHEAELNALLNGYEQNGDSHNVAPV